MKFFKYLHYFFYVAWNWDLKLAWFVIRCEIKGEKKYQLDTIGADDLKSLEKKGVDISHATMYMPVNFFVLDHLLAEIRKYTDSKTFLDLGCGKGRAMVVAANYGFTDITGIDFSKKFCEDA